MLFKKRSQIFLIITLVFFLFINIVSAAPYYFEQIGYNYGNFPFFYSGFYQDPWQFYQSFPYWPDTILIVCLFVILMRALLQKTKVFGEEHGSTVGGIIGFILGLSLSVYLNAIGVHAIVDFGPFVIAALIIVLVLLIYRWAKDQKKGSMSWFLVTILLILFALLFMFPQLIDRIPFLRYILILVFLLLIIGLIATFINGLPGVVSSSDGKEGKKDPWWKRWFGKDKNKKPSNGEDGERPDGTPYPKPQKNKKLTKVEIIISPVSKNDTYAVSGNPISLNLFANVFEKRILPFTSTQSNRSLHYDWVIAGVRSSDHGPQIETVINPPRAGQSKILIQITVTDPESRQQITNSRLITIVGGNPILEIISPVHSRETLTIDVDSNKDIYFNVRLDPSGYSDVRTKNVGWYIIPRMVDEISKRELDDSKTISTDLQFNKKFSELRLAPGSYTVFAAALSSKGSLIMPTVWWNSGDRAVAVDHIFIKVNPGKKNEEGEKEGEDTPVPISSNVKIKEPATRESSKNNPFIIKRGDPIPLKAELSGELLNNILWSIYQGRGNNPDKMYGERIGEGLIFEYKDTSHLNPGFYTIFAVGVQKKRFGRTEISKEKDYIFIEIKANSKDEEGSPAFIRITKPLSREDSVKDPEIININDKIILESEYTPEIKNVLWTIEKGHNKGASEDVISELGEGKKIVVDFNKLPENRIFPGDYTICAYALNDKGNSMGLMDYIWIELNEDKKGKEKAEKPTIGDKVRIIQPKEKENFIITDKKTVFNVKADKSRNILKTIWFIPNRTKDFNGFLKNLKKLKKYQDHDSYVSEDVSLEIPIEVNQEGNYTIIAVGIDLNNNITNDFDFINLTLTPKEKKKGIITKIKDVFSGGNIEKGELNINFYDENKEVLFNLNIEDKDEKFVEDKLEINLNKRYYIEAIFRQQVPVANVNWNFKLDKSDRFKVTSNKRACVLEFKNPGVKDIIFSMNDDGMGKNMTLRLNVGIKNVKDPSLSIVRINDKNVKTDDSVSVLLNSNVKFGLLVNNQTLIKNFGLYIINNEKQILLGKYNTNIFDFKLDNRFPEGTYEIAIVALDDKDEVVFNSKNKPVMDGLFLGVVSLPVDKKDIFLDVNEVIPKGKNFPSQHFTLNKANNKAAIKELVTYTINPSITWENIKNYKIRFSYQEGNKIKFSNSNELRLRYKEGDLGDKNINCELLDKSNAVISSIDCTFNVIKLIPISPQLNFDDYEMKVDIDKEVEIEVKVNDPQNITKQFAWLVFENTRSNKPLYTKLSYENKIKLPLQEIIKRKPNPSYVLRVMSLSKVFTKPPELKDLEKNRWPESVTNIMIIPNLEKFS